MEASQSLPELVAAAQANADVHEQQIAEIVAVKGDAPDDQAEALRAATSAIELLAVDIYAVFEARMQHHFKRGPFSRKLKALLTGAGQPDLAYRIYQYYLAVNVLKHGTGVSHRELMKGDTHLFGVRTVEEAEVGDSLIDVTAPGFFDGLTTAILEVHQFLER
tara:strand:+ start:111301 stop:111789 length:489 start_codon:yes stop_codon:yes gene_type:complete